MGIFDYFRKKKVDSIITKKEKDDIEYLAETLDIPYTTVLRMNDEDYQNEYKKLMDVKGECF